MEKTPNKRINMLFGAKILIVSEFIIENPNIIMNKKIIFITLSGIALNAYLKLSAEMIRKVIPKLV